MIKSKKKRQKELDAAYKEQATTIEWEPSSEFRFPKIATKKNKRLTSKLILFLFTIVLILIAAIVSLWKFAFTEESDIQTGSYLEQMKEIANLASSQAVVKVIIEKEDNELFGKEIDTNIPGTQRKILLVVPGTVTAGINLEEITTDHLKIEEGKKKLTLYLPHASFLQDPSIDFEQVETYSISGLFRGEVDWEEAYSLANEAKEEIRKEAVEQGILEQAETSAETTLKEFYRQLGYSVDVRFMEE